MRNHIKNRWPLYLALVTFASFVAVIVNAQRDPGNTNLHVIGSIKGCEFYSSIAHDSATNQTRTIVFTSASVSGQSCGVQVIEGTLHAGPHRPEPR